ncbi:MAG: response regulator [Caldithrix sp.]|nr:response regulator [Caldithrix sp.]
MALLLQISFNMVNEKPLDRKNIMVVDPDEDFCRNVRLYLEDNYSVMSRQGLEFLDYSIILYQIDLVLLDADFATHESIKLLKDLKINHPRLKIVVMYVYLSLDREIEKSLAQHADDMIAKPFDVDVLKSKVDQLLGFSAQPASS